MCRQARLGSDLGRPKRRQTLLLVWGNDDKSTNLKTDPKREGVIGGLYSMAFKKRGGNRALGCGFWRSIARMIFASVYCG